MDYLPEVICAAQKAGDILESYFYSAFSHEITIKKDKSPVTKADVAADKFIREQLVKIDPTIPILSEESEIPDFSVRQQWSRYWLIDPLDGTRGFIRRSPEFSVNIALVENHKPTLGVVYSPIEKNTYYAQKNQGAFFSDENKNVQKIMTAAHDAKQLRFLCGHFDRALPYQKILQDFFGAVSVTQMNSALKFPHVAKGMADVYVRFGQTSEWDSAAGQCVLEEAGGAVVDFQGHPLHYNAKSSLINPSFIAMGDVSQLQKYIDIFGKIAKERKHN